MADVQQQKWTGTETCERGRDDVILSNIKATHFSYYSWKIMDQQVLEARNRVDRMPSKAQEDAVINMKSIQDLSKQLGFEWPILAYELGFTRTEVRQFHATSMEKRDQAKSMLESWYERSWDKPNKTKVLQDGLERAGRRDLAERLRCLHWGHQKLSRRVELPSAFPFLITVHKTIENKEGLRRINELNRSYT